MTTIISEMPLYGEPYYEYSFNIEDSVKIITFRWVDRTSSWYIDIKQDDLTPVIDGVRLVPSYPILIDYALEDSGITGYLFLFDAGDFISDKLSTGPEALPQYYRLIYVYEGE